MKIVNCFFDLSGCVLFLEIPSNMATYRVSLCFVSRDVTFMMVNCFFDPYFAANTGQSYPRCLCKSVRYGRPTFSPQM